MHVLRLLLSGACVLIGIGLFLVFLSEGRPITALVLIAALVCIGKLTITFSE